MPKGVDWTPAMIAELKQLWGKKSAADISDYFRKFHKITLSRSAVLGKVHRLGIGGSNSAKTRQQSAGTKARANAPKRPRTFNDPLKAGVKYKRNTVSRPIPLPGYEVQHRVRLADAVAFHCRYTTQEPTPEMMICGNKVLKGKHYCAGCYPIVYSAYGREVTYNDQ